MGWAAHVAVVGCGRWGGRTLRPAPLRPGPTVAVAARGGRRHVAHTAVGAGGVAGERVGVAVARVVGVPIAGALEGFTASRLVLIVGIVLLVLDAQALGLVDEWFLLVVI